LKKMISGLLKQSAGENMVLSYNQINDIAQGITNSYCRDVFSPVDIESLLKDMLEISVEYYTLHPRGNILGMCSNCPQMVKVKDGDEIILAQLNENVIFIDSSLKDIKVQGRRMFTIAHEGGHMFLFKMEGKKDTLAHRYYRALPVSRKFDWDEWQADAMASCLLMPEPNIRYVFELFFQSNHIEKINPFDKFNYSAFSAMADFFKVSKTALGIRLKKLRLIDSFTTSKSLDIKTEV